jgi:hypothetical protein
MIIRREWHMPHRNTFSIKPIGDLLHRHISGLSIDPFANSNRFAQVTNDLDPDMGCDHNMDALDFLKMWGDSSVDTVLFDPPYSPRQVSECYTKLGKTVNMQTTQASFWGDMKKEIGRIVRPRGKVITCGWNSGGVGKKYGMEIVEILLVAHGGWHNDTIVTVETKTSTLI